MGGRMLTATAMALRDTSRRPLILILLVLLPAYVITRSIAETEGTPQQIGLPGGDLIGSNMRDIHAHGRDVIAFAAGLVGVFVMQSALQGDRRLVLAGFRPSEAITACLVACCSGDGPGGCGVGDRNCLRLRARLLDPVPRRTDADRRDLRRPRRADRCGVGQARRHLPDPLRAMTDVSIVQNPMFGDGTPDGWAVLLPGYGPRD